MKILDYYIEKDQEDAISFVIYDLGNDNQDSVDIQKKITIDQNRKLCSSGHINDDVKSDRTVCDRQHCKSKLELENPIAMKPSKKEINHDDVEKENLQAKQYMNVPNISNGKNPKKMTVGALLTGLRNVWMKLLMQLA